MAAPGYSSDLADIALCETGTWTEPTGATVGALTNNDTDNFIQQSASTTKTTGVGAPGLAGMGFQAAAGIAIASPAAVFIWIFHGAPASINVIGSGGYRVIVGSTLANYDMWTVHGRDTFAYGGWECVAVDPNVTRDYRQGTPSGTFQYFGSVIDVTSAISKGNPYANDAIRWGRVITAIAGDGTLGYALFSGLAAANDAVAARWGQFQAIPGGYRLQGKLALGSSGTAVDFRDSNANIVIANTLKVSSGFNEIEIVNAGSRVDWTTVQVTALGTVSRGKFTVTNDADVNLQSCIFAGMDTFAFLAATAALGCTFRGCNAVTAPGSDLRGSSVLVPTVAADASGLIWNAAVDPDGKLDNMVFTKGTNAHHAIEFGTSSPTTMTLRGIAFGTGFNASNAANDSTLRFLRTSGTITVNLIGCTGNISYKKESGATVNFVVDPVSLSVHVQDINTGSAIVGARVWVPVTSTAGGKPYLASVTIVSTGTTATVTHNSHGMATNDWIWIKGATQPEYNGTAQITKIDDNSYSYTMVGDPTSPATGTITATFVVINAATNGSGNASASYSWLADQPVSGRVRTATGAGPYYKTAPVAGDIDSTAGLAVTVQLIPDA